MGRRLQMAVGWPRLTGTFSIHKIATIAAASVRERRRYLTCRYFFASLAVVAFPTFEAFSFAISTTLRSCAYTL